VSAAPRSPDSAGSADAPPGEHPSWPTVGVVVATRDRPELLREALASITAQDYPGTVRTLVVFDQSGPDDSLVSSDERRPVAVTTNPRSPGLAGARNSGILAQSCELVAFCDDDDTWLPGRLSAQVGVLRRDPAAEFVCCGIRIAYDGHTVDRILPAEQIGLPDLLRSRVTELHPSTFLIRRSSVVDGFGLVNEAIPGGYGEDYEFLLRAARHAPIRNVAEVQVVVRWHARSYFANRWQTISTALSWLLEHYPEFQDEPHGQARVTGQIAFAEAALGARRSAARWAGRTIRRNPREPRAYLALAVASGALRADSVLRQLHRRGHGI
jgi:glycosyltransferase involved in cell wall biosynthesis